MKNSTVLAATLLGGGLALGVGTAGSTADSNVTDHAVQASSATATSMASCYSGPEGDADIPDGYGESAGVVLWHDYNGYTGDDQDNFQINDAMFDAQSSSLWVKNNSTGETDYSHVYHGNRRCLDVGNIPDGQTASWNACGWDNNQLLDCRSGTVRE